MRSRTDNLGIRSDATASHANVTYTARFSVSEGGKRIFSDTVQALVSYNILDDQYATVSAMGNSADQAISEVSEEIKVRLAIFFEKQQRQLAANH
jgi:LPS-assembly lipoprotein